MRVQSLISKLLYKAAPMLPTEREDIERNMDLWFDKQLQAVKEKQKTDGVVLTMKDRAFLLLDEWYIRALCAFSYIFLVRWIADFMNPGEEEELPGDLLDRR